MIYKQKDITANINNKSVNIGNIGVNFYTEDEQTASIRLNIKNNGQPINLDKVNMKPKLDVFCSDGSIFTDEKLEVILAEQGIVQYAIPNKVIKHIGNVDAKLFLESENESVHVANFSFTIVDSGVEGKVIKEVNIPLLANTVQKIMLENSDAILGESFKDDVSNDFLEYVKANPESFKGPQGEQGIQGIQGSQGIKGDKGDTGSINVIDTGWLSLTLLNNIQNNIDYNFSNGNTIGYRIINFNGIRRVFVRGSINNITNSNGTITTLPNEIVNHDIPVFTTRCSNVSKNVQIFINGNSLKYYSNNALTTNETVQFYSSWLL